MDGLSTEGWDEKLVLYRQRYTTLNSVHPLVIMNSANSVRAVRVGMSTATNGRLRT